MGEKVATNIVHICEISSVSFVDPKCDLLRPELISNDFFLINLRSKHADYEIVHSGILMRLFEAVKNLYGANEEIGRH